MKKRTLQIDIKGFHEENDRVVEFNLIVDGRTCLCYTSRSNYEALIYDGFFVRDGKEKDSAGILNTTKMFDERQ
jgi:hypothetical protein